MTSAQTTLTVVSLVILAFTGCTSANTAQRSALATSAAEQVSTPELAHESEGAKSETDLEMLHIHGLGFSPDGEQIIVPTHNGLRVYQAGKWSTPDLPAHDYAGYAPTDDGFYASGHPNPLPVLPQPLGLIKGIDGGKRLVDLGLAAQSDYHLIAVGYQNHVIYVDNPVRNASMRSGIHYSLDDGQTWQQSALQGLTAQLIQMAVHPTDANRVALAAEDGVWLSSDYGNSFARIGDEQTVTAVTFHPKGQSLLFGYHALSTYDLASQQISQMQSPIIAAEDAISYIAIDPVQPDEIALATFSRDIYLSEGGGDTWKLIVEDGMVK